VLHILPFNLDRKRPRPISGQCFGIRRQNGPNSPLPSYSDVHVNRQHITPAIASTSFNGLRISSINECPLRAHRCIGATRCSRTPSGCNRGLLQTRSAQSPARLAPGPTDTGNTYEILDVKSEDKRPQGPSTETSLPHTRARVDWTDAVPTESRRRMLGKAFRDRGRDVTHSSRKRPCAVQKRTSCTVLERAVDFSWSEQDTTSTFIAATPKAHRRTHT
jgi:hypothetical protein